MSIFRSLFTVLITVLILACGPIRAEDLPAELAITPSSTVVPPASVPQGSTSSSPAKSKSKSKKSKKEKEPSLLKDVETHYSQTSALSATIKKTLKLKMLDSERLYDGALEIKKPGKFRLEFTTPEKSIAVTDGKTIWIVTPPADPSFDNTTRVIRSRRPGKNQGGALITFLLGKGDLLKEFSVTKTSEKDGQAVYELAPKTKQDEMVKLQLTVEKEKKEIIQIRFWDNLENETTLELKDTKFDLDLKNDRFEYKPPKGAEITDI